MQGITEPRFNGFIERFCANPRAFTRDQLAEHYTLNALACLSQAMELINDANALPAEFDYNMQRIACRLDANLLVSMADGDIMGIEHMGGAYERNAKPIRSAYAFVNAWLAATR